MFGQETEKALVLEKPEPLEGMKRHLSKAGWGRGDKSSTVWNSADARALGHILGPDSPRLCKNLFSVKLCATSRKRVGWLWCPSTGT